MEGTPADLRTYIDTGTFRDHSYYGNGCPNGWGGDGTGGSITPCNTRIVQSEDNESQENGTYYHFQAATSGSGGAISTDNATVPDSFCPLGWQLPYSGTGGDYYDKSRSWYYLINKYDIPTDQQGVKKMNSYPFAYIFPGDFFWGLGRLYSQGNSGYFWSPNTGTSASYTFNVSGASLNTAALQSKVFGATIRCIRLQLHRRHGGRNKCIIRP